MTVSVLVPWRPTPDRAPLWAFLRPRWEALGHEVAEGSCGGGPWCKAVAVADALSRATGDVLVIADADVWCDPYALTLAIGAVAPPVLGPWRWAVPHGKVYRLTPAATTNAQAGRGWSTRDEDCTRKPYRGFAGGGVTVLTRALYERVPLDPRFYGWGQEDESWARALTVLAGKPWRGNAPLWHLWHEPAPQIEWGVGSREGLALAVRYRQAFTALAMRALINEFRQPA